MDKEMNFPLTFEGITAANNDRVSYFGHGTISDGWNVAEWGCALAGEVGELCNILKKINRGAEFDPSSNELKTEAAKEIADVYLYLDLVSQKLGIHIPTAIQGKFNETSINCSFPQRLVKSNDSD